MERSAEGTVCFVGARTPYVSCHHGPVLGRSLLQVGCSGAVWRNAPLRPWAACIAAPLRRWECEERGAVGRRSFRRSLPNCQVEHVFRKEISGRRDRTDCA